MPTKNTFSLKLYRLALGAAATLTIGVSFWLAGSSHSEEVGVSSEPKANTSPIVVELFTSQGCSSCPAADRVLSQLGQASLDGDESVIPLSYHVDYWNYIGWQDPFSHARWSKRQEEYAQALRSRRLYTPQAIVQGQEDCVGSRSTCVLEAIARARRETPKAHLEGEIFETSSPNQLALTLRATLEETISTDRLQVVAIVFETGLRTEIDSGENARRTLENDFVVRSLTPAFTISPANQVSKEGKVTLNLDPQWQREEVGVAALLQDSESLEIHASWSVRHIPL